MEVRNEFSISSVHLNNIYAVSSSTSRSSISIDESNGVIDTVNITNFNSYQVLILQQILMFQVMLVNIM